MRASVGVSRSGAGHPPCDDDCWAPASGSGSFLWAASGHRERPVRSAVPSSGRPIVLAAPPRRLRLVTAVA